MSRRRWRWRGAGRWLMGTFERVSLDLMEVKVVMFWLLAASRGAPPEGAHRRKGPPAGRGPPRERRVPPAGAVAEVIREKGPTRVQSRCRRPPYPIPSNGPPSAPGRTPPHGPRERKHPAPLMP
ncbi:unnamed protein product [Pleuronectes platessa]|uniref:Uncharacterized protein n=1 Tax=Pleuronectes platessa TaxID=8262 RepID=A0A9N7YZ70_PLEPL|nr:unnamed protein product [Pleuronectes platessa]